MPTEKTREEIAQEVKDIFQGVIAADVEPGDLPPDEELLELIEKAEKIAEDGKIDIKEVLVLIDAVVDYVSYIDADDVNNADFIDNVTEAVITIVRYLDDKFGINIKFIPDFLEIKIIEWFVRQGTAFFVEKFR